MKYNIITSKADINKITQELLIKEGKNLVNNKKNIIYSLSRYMEQNTTTRKINRCRQ